MEPETQGKTTKDNARATNLKYNSSVNNRLKEKEK